MLVNNVGIGPENLAEDVTEDDFDLTVDVNLKGTFFTTQAVGRLMIAQQGGRIVNMSSQAGSVVLHGESIYCMTKAAINHLTRCLASEWAPHGITVNSIAPTFIYTDGTAPALSDPDFKRKTLAQIPVGRIGDPKDVAAAVVFLASPASSLITGTNLLVDGGWSVISTSASPRTPTTTSRRSVRPPETTHTESESADPFCAPARTTAEAGTSRTSLTLRTTSDTDADIPGSGVAAGFPSPSVPPS